MRKGTIIFLNGLTSTGKTSICEELAGRELYSFFVLGFDMFEETIPDWSYTDERYAKAIIAMYHAARSFSDQGQDVIIDGLIMKIPGLENHYEIIKQIFEGYPLKIIDVFCSMEILRQRNIERGNRRENQSLEQSKHLENNVDFLFQIDSGKYSVKECVDMLTRVVDFQKINTV